MEGKRVSESRVFIGQVMNPDNANPAGNVHGGDIMKLIDTAGGVAATRHARAHVVTASIDRLDFHSPVYIGNLLRLTASINFVGKKSMEIGVRVEAENIYTGEVRHTASAYLTYVPLDSEGRAIEVPPIEFVTEEETRRNCEAQERRKWRLAERHEEKNGTNCDKQKLS